jgi:LytR cell envelope-related transcriptional attenuator
VLGIAVLVVAFLALRSPHHNTAAAGSQTITATHTVSPSVPTSSSGAGSASGSAPSDTAFPSGSLVPSDTASSPSKHSAIGSQPLVVLNAVGTPHLATDAATQFENGGWTVSHIGNYTNNFLSTAAYYDPSVPGSRRAATALQRQFPFIKRVVERFAQLPPGPVVVVLWNDYTGG